jgi:hypothetical protein
MFGDFLYQLAPRDEVGNAIVPTWRQIDQTLNNISIDGQILLVPNDLIFVISAFDVYALADVGTTPRVTRLYMVDLSTNRPVDIWADYWGVPVAGTNFASSSRSTLGMVFVPPGWSVQVQAQFAGAFANNRLFAHLLGYFLPKGNISIP